MIWTRPLRAGIADYRVTGVRSACSRCMSPLSLPETAAKRR